MYLQVITQLPISNTFVNKLVEQPHKFYSKKEQPKMKFGREQLDENQVPKMRTTFAPIAFLKSIQQDITKYLQKIELPNCMYGAVKEKNNIINALQHVYANYFFTVDLKDFFTNITNKQVNRALRNYGFSWDDARIITKLCTSNRCLPQGAPSSSTLANIAFSYTAALLESFCNEKNITFTVFVDDLTFSAKYDFSMYKYQILDIITQDGFFPNREKIHYRHKSCEITGLIVKNQKIYLEKGMLNYLDNPRIKAYADNVEKYFKVFQQENKRLNVIKTKSLP